MSLIISVSLHPCRQVLSVYQTSANANSTLTIGGSGYVWDGASLEASRSNFIYGGRDTVMPGVVNLLVILHLGDSAA